MDLRCKQPSKYGHQRHCTACTAHHIHGVSLSVDSERLSPGLLINKYGFIFSQSTPLINYWFILHALFLLVYQLLWVFLTTVVEKTKSLISFVRSSMSVACNSSSTATATFATFIRFSRLLRTILGTSASATANTTFSFPRPTNHKISRSASRFS